MPNWKPNTDPAGFIQLLQWATAWNQVFVCSKGKKIDKVRVVQEERFKDGHTIAGTRENHQFVPIDDKKIRISKVSNDTSSLIAHVNRSVRSEMPFVSIANLQPGQYIACIYDINWWYGNISQISVDNHDALINFMHHHVPLACEKWYLLDSRAVNHCNTSSTSCNSNGTTIQLLLTNCVANSATIPDHLDWTLWFGNQQKKPNIRFVIIG